MTGRDLGELRDRSVVCSLSGGRLTWPEVRLSDGRSVRLCFRLWSEEEKELYRLYRSGKKEAVKDDKAPDTGGGGTDAEGEVAKDVPGGSPSGVSARTAALVREADRCLGIWLFDGVRHALLARPGDRGAEPVALSLIPPREARRLGL